jgi:hypothetical protein
LSELAARLGDLNNGISHAVLIRSKPSGRPPKSITEKVNRSIAWGAVMRLTSFGYNQTTAVRHVAAWLGINERTLRSDEPLEVRGKALMVAFADQFAVEDQGKPDRLKKILVREIFGDAAWKGGKPPSFPRSV